MAELAYDDQPERLADAKVAVLLASLIAAGLATVVLRAARPSLHRATEADTEANPPEVPERIAGRPV